MNVAVAGRLREIGLSVPQCDVLTTLTEAEGVSQQELAKRLYVTKGNISGRSTAADRRQYEIYLTGPGRESAGKAIAIQHDFIGATLGKLSGDDLGALERLLVALRDQIRAHDTESAGG